MKYIAVVECVSSGILYVDEIISRGFKPLIVNVYMSEFTEDLVHYREMVAQRYADRVEYIDEGPDFEAFVARLKKYDIAAVFPGSEYGVRLADRMNRVLGLRGNDDRTTHYRCNKAGMYEALGKAGIRRIESAHVYAEDDIRKFWKENDLDRCVMKYAESAATVGLKICSNVEDAVEHYKVMKSSRTYKGELDADILIQEYIGGTEYIVDTLSCDGRHMLTDVWVYSKIRSEDGTLAYDYSRLVKDLEPGHNEMIKYAYAVLDAVGMKWGLCHSEIKVDSKGPVLIETNARPIGLAMTHAYLDEILGYHLTDLAIESYFHPFSFDRMMHKPYSPRKYALMKLMIVPEDFKGSFLPTFVISNMVRSARELLFFGLDGISDYKRTVDLETSPLTIKMANSDYGELMKDYELIHLIESNYFHLFYTLGEKVEGCELETDLSMILKQVDPVRKTLIVKDDGQYVAKNGKVERMTDWQIFDGVIFAECGETTAEERYRHMYKSMHDVREGGLCVVVPEACKNLKSGSVVTEFIMCLAGFQIIAPFNDSVGFIIGLKK
ncbi:MAG: ATP-grasp domain-containing protein [Thermoplasmata archaeon]|nr:ATP-grasp domain-containing protein [Thermoplasmata archaeon]